MVKSVQFTAVTVISPPVPTISNHSEFSIEGSPWKVTHSSHGSPVAVAHELL